MGASSGRNARILVDRGADEHVCPTDFESAPPLGPMKGSMLYDAQQYVIEAHGTRTVYMRLGPWWTGYPKNHRCHREPLCVSTMVQRSEDAPPPLLCPCSHPAVLPCPWHLSLVFYCPGPVQSLGGDFPANEVDLHLGLLDGSKPWESPFAKRSASTLAGLGVHSTSALILEHHAGCQIAIAGYRVDIILWSADSLTLFSVHVVSTIISEIQPGTGSRWKSFKENGTASASEIGIEIGILEGILGEIHPKSQSFQHSRFVSVVSITHWRFEARVSPTPLARE